MGLLDTIKQAGKDAIASDNPVAVLFATVTSTEPLEVNIGQRFSLDEHFLVVPESLTPAEITVGGAVYPIRSGLVPGDRVILLRIQGGNRYLLLDKVVEA